MALRECTNMVRLRLQHILCPVLASFALLDAVTRSA